VLGACALTLAACGETPKTTEHARGVLTGANIVLAMTIVLIVLSGALVVGAVGLDRIMKARKALAEAPETTAADNEDDEPEVVAGIGIGKAPVPRWLYAFYVLIPLFALLYVLNGVALAPKAATPAATASAAPTVPVTQATIVASGIKFDKSTLMLKTNASVTVLFKNEDASVPHNFTVWPSQAVAQAGDVSKAIHPGNTITGVAESTEKFKTGPPGKLFFECTIHPTSMFGNIVVA
jgi:plastocyanin